MEQLFILFSLLTIISSLMVIITINPIHSVFWLTLTFIESSIIFIILEIDFIALMLIIVYVGAIAILFLFVIMMIDTLKFGGLFNISNLLPISILIGVSFFTSLRIFTSDQLYYIKLKYFTKEWELDYFSNIKTIGQVLYTDFSASFILASFVLLIAMIGAVILTYELGKETKKQLLFNQQSRNNSWI